MTAGSDVARIIAGSGMYVPDAVVTNDDLARLMDTSDRWIRERTGVAERRLAEPGIGTSELAAEAGKAALADAGLEPVDVDALVLATMTPDHYAPGSVGLVQDRMGLRDVPAFGLRQQCSGFLYGLELADSLLVAGKAETVLVIGAEVHAGIQPWAAAWRAMQQGREIGPDDRARNDRYRSWAVLFGDGAGAVVMRSRDRPGAGVLGSALFTDGSLFELIHIPAMGSQAQPYVDVATIAGDGHMPTMQGSLLYRKAVRLMPEAVEEVVADAGLMLNDVDLVIAHQANERILEGVRKRLGMDADRLPSNLGRYGNTTAGTLPILFHEMRQAGRVRPGALVVFTSFGAGAHWGAVLYREPG